MSDVELVASCGGVSQRRARLRGEHGSSTMLTAALLTPVFIVVLFAAVQAALWGHARTTARVAARDAAAQVARFEVDPEAARASAVANLSGGALRNVVVDIPAGGDVVVVTITGDAPGIIIGTSREISVTEAVPVEELTP
jgi:Flp pilus assembly protein TadG